MRVVSILLIVTFLLTTSVLQAQAPVIQWHKVYGGFNGDYAYSVRPTIDGGYILAGSTEFEGRHVAGYHGNAFIGDFWVIKLNADGELEWQRCIGGTYLDGGSDIRQTPDGGYIVMGHSASVECEIAGVKGSTDLWVVKLSPKGNMEWQKHYGTTGTDYGSTIDYTSDGGYILSGYVDPSGTSIEFGFYVVKIDAAGNQIWEKSLGGTRNDQALGARGTPDGGCIVVGFTQSTDGDVTCNHGKNDGWIIKLGNTGNVQWKKCLGGSQDDLLWAVELSDDGGYVVAGQTSSDDGDVSGKHSPGIPSSDFWVVKLNNAGIIQWQKCYGGDYNEIAKAIHRAPDNGFVIGGTSTSANGDLSCFAGAEDFWVIKINSTGTLEWSKSMGGTYFDQALSVYALNDGSFVAAGNTCSSNVFGQSQQTSQLGTCGDFWIIKLTAPVAVSPAPVVTVKPATVCTGATTLFRANAQYVGTNATYEWFLNNVPQASGTDTWTSTNLKNNDVVSCRVTRGGDCHTPGPAVTGSITVTLNNTVTQAQIGISASSTVICDCDWITFTANVSNGTNAGFYEWLVNGKYVGVNSNPFITASLKSGDEVSCIYRDASICIPTGSAASNTITMTDGISQAPSVTIAAVGNPACTGSLVNFTATATNAGTSPSYQWKVNGTNVGTNTVTYSSSSLSNGDVVTCTITKDPMFTCVTVPNANSNAITITIGAKTDPEVTIATNSTSVCTGASVTFSAAPINAGANPTYNWKVNGVEVNIQTRTFTTSALIDGDEVSCDIRVDPGYTCTNTSQASSNIITMTVTTQVPPTVSISVQGDNVCAPARLRFTADVQNAGASPSYQWIVDNQPVGNNSPTLNITASNSVQVQLAITPGSGLCNTAPVNSNSIFAVVHPLPIVSISPSDTLIKAGGQVQLRATIQANMGHFKWDLPGKLQDPTVVNPTTIALTENTRYTLYVESDRGCRASADAIVRVGRLLAMPNAFTPNNDGKHDVFRIPPFVLFSLKEFTIYDRWGNRIFSTKDISKGWDGTFKGQKLNTGVYVYMITGSNEQGNVVVKGTINLVR